MHWLGLEPRERRVVGCCGDETWSAVDARGGRGRDEGRRGGTAGDEMCGEEVVLGAQVSVAFLKEGELVEQLRECQLGSSPWSAELTE